MNKIQKEAKAEYFQKRKAFYASKKQILHTMNYYEQMARDVPISENETITVLGFPESNYLPSVTRPGMALTVEQILERFSSGHPLPNYPNLVSTGDDIHYPDFRMMDMVEIDEYTNKVNHDIFENTEKLKAIREEILKKKTDKEIARRARIQEKIRQKTLDEEISDAESD